MNGRFTLPPSHKCGAYSFNENEIKGNLYIG